MGVKPSTFGPWIRGVDASTGVLTQPKASIPRSSNLLLSKRGSLRTCDGSSLIDAFNGVATSGRGRAMAEFFFAPTGVAGYYLRIMAALDQHLGPPQNLAASLTTATGTLTIGQPYFWVVTALDGIGGETTVSNEVTLTPTSGHQMASLTWQAVPNASGYNIYRGTATGAETLLVGKGVPVKTNSFTDDGSTTQGITLSIASAVVSFVVSPGTIFASFTLSAASPISLDGMTFVYTAGSNAHFNGGWRIVSIPSAKTFSVQGVPGSLHQGDSTIGGSGLFSQFPPNVDNTQQTALYAMPPAVDGISYTDANIVALFPASQAGGTAQQGYSPSGGMAGNVALVPQMVQFTNQAVLALGNGFAPQVYSDPNGTPTNPATSVAISAISVDANGVVTITTSAPHNISPTYPSSTYTSWSPNTVFAVGDIVQPSTPNGYYYTATAISGGGQSGPNPPNWPTTIGQSVFDGVSVFSIGLGVTWQCTALVSSGLTTNQGVGANVVISGVTNSLYNTNGNGVSSFVTVSIVSSTVVKIVNLNAIGAGSSSGGTLTVSTIPVVSTFLPAFPIWTKSVYYSVNSVIVPETNNGYYYKATQPGQSGTTQPVFPTTVSATVTDGGVTWQNAGTLASAAPPPPGCAHLAVYAGSCWMFNTWITDTGPNSNTGTNATNPLAPATDVGLDGPTSLRMSDVNNLKSWNPINQAFLDKDDGAEGLGLASFTIAAQGIPPEGSLCAFKRRAVYQIIGVFGASNFAIQRTQSDMGILAPRTLQFVPGFGLVRLTYIGYAVFDGLNDRIISTQVEPYLIGSNDPDDADIIPMDPQWQTVSQAALAANPPMYVSAIPIAYAPGSSLGALTRIMCFDLVLKAWGIVDLPFPISTMFGAVTFSTVAQTVFGSFNDGTLQQWQANDLTWATSVSGSNTPAKVSWSLRTPTCASRDASERLYLRRVSVMGQQTSAAPSTMTIEIRNGGASLGVQKIAMPASGDFQVQGAAGSTGRRFDANISGQGMVTIDSISFDLVPRPIGVLSGAIS